MKLSEHTAIEVVDAIASHFAIKLAFADDLRSDTTGTAEATLRRAEAMYVLRQFGMSYPEIGRLFKRDHTTVLAACRRVEERLQTHVGYKEQVGALIDLARGVVVLTQKREKMEEAIRTGRQKLPDEREGYTHKVEITCAKPGGDPNAPSEIEVVDVYIQVSEYPDGRLGEIFVKIGKHGDEHAVYDEWSTLASKALQHGVPVETVFKSCVGKNYGKAGPTSNKNIPKCTSILDYVGRWVLSRYGKKAEAQP